METTTEKQEISAINQLAPVERAYLALSADHNEQALVKLAGKYVDVTEIKDRADYAMVMRGGIELMKARTAIQATGKAAREDATAYRNAVLAEEKRLIAITKPEETRLKGLRNDYDDGQERIAEEARILEQRRIADITERIQAIRNQTEGLLGADADAIQMRLDAVSTILCNETLFGEFVDTAMEVKAAAVTSLETALAERVVLEDQQAEQQRVAEEQATRQAELDRQAKDQLEREAVAQEKAAAEQDRISSRNQCISDIRSSADGAAGLSQEGIRNRISALDEADLSEDVWQEFQTGARTAISETLHILEQSLTDRVKFDEEKADLERREAEHHAEEERRLTEEHAEVAKVKAEKDRLEREARDREKAEQLKAEQEAEAARQEALKPEKDKLMEWAEYLDGIAGPDVSDPQLKELRNDVEHAVSLAGSTLMKAIEAL